MNKRVKIGKRALEDRRRAERFEELENKKTVGYIISHNTENVYCSRCGSPVLLSDLSDTENEYKYQCLSCDEDLYEIETYKGDDFGVVEIAMLLELCQALDLDKEE